MRRIRLPFPRSASPTAPERSLRPSLESLQRARSSTIERFFVDHNSRNMERIRERLKRIRKAVSRRQMMRWSGIAAGPPL